MGITRADLEEPGISEEELQSRIASLEPKMKNEEWTHKMLKDVGVLLTSHPGNRPFLKASIESHKALDYWICLAYDNYIDPEQPDIDYNRIMPSKDVMDGVDTFIMPHHQTWGGVLFPYMFLLRFGALALSHFKYVYCTNGDFIIEKPENFSKLFELMGDADIMTCGHDEPGKYANTAGFIVRSDCLNAITKHMLDYLIPFEVYEKHTQEIGNSEGRFGRAISDLKLKQKIVDPPHDDMLTKPGVGTWCELLGFRHIHAEFNWAYKNKGIPPDSKYLDERFVSQHDLVHIKKYEETKDKTVLDTWYQKD